MPLTCSPLQTYLYICVIINFKIMKKPMLTLCIIPARYASTRFPGKPLANILGKPMVQWVYERAAKAFEHVYVATDDQRIADAVSAFGGKFVITSTEHKSGTDRCAEALDKIQIQTKKVFDIVLNIQGDEPFVHAEHLLMLVKPFSKKDVDIATLVKPFSTNEDIFNPNSPKVVVSANGKALYFSRSVIPHVRGVEIAQWASEHTYFKHLGLYAYRSNVLMDISKLEQSPLEKAESLEQLRWLENGYTIYAGKTNIETIAIDTPADLERAIAWAEKNEKF